MHLLPSISACASSTNRGTSWSPWAAGPPLSAWLAAALSFGSTPSLEASTVPAPSCSGPLHGGPVFLAPFALYLNRTENIYTDDDLVANVATSEAGGGLSLGVSAGSLAGGPSHLPHSRLPQPCPIGNTRRSSEGWTGGATGASRLELNSLDDPFFPSRGSRVTPSVQWFTKAPGTEEAFGIARFEGTGAIPFHRNTPLPSPEGRGVLRVDAAAALSADTRRSCRARALWQERVPRAQYSVRWPHLSTLHRVGSRTSSVGPAISSSASRWARLSTTSRRRRLTPTSTRASPFRRSSARASSSLFVGTGGSVRLQVNVGTLLH